MNQTIKLFIITGMIGLFASCSKNPEKLLVKSDSGWRVISVTTNPGFGTQTDTSDITFTDAAGTMKDVSGTTSTSFTWVYDKKTAEMTLTEVDGTDTIITTYNVTDISKNTETWTFVTGTQNGFTFTTLDFTRVSKLVRK